MVTFLDLKKVNAQYAEELKEAASVVIDSGRYLQGKYTELFENKLAEYIGVKYAIAVGNGLDALRIILKAYIEMGFMQEGDEIIVPANTFIATILAISDNRLSAILVEPDLKTYNLDISLIEKNITKKTKAIIVVHLYGKACWDLKLVKLAKKYNLKLIEDNAQAIGAKWGFSRTGSLGDAAALSFYPGKNLGALGDSGAIITSDQELSKIVRVLANYGSEKKYVNSFLGMNSRMDELQAAFLCIKIKYLDKENDVRREIADYYISNINNSNITLPSSSVNEDSVWHLFVIRCNKRDDLQLYMYQNSIQTLIHYPIPPHKQECYRNWNYHKYPITEKIHREVLSLPISPVLSNEEFEHVVKIANSFH